MTQLPTPFYFIQVAADSHINHIPYYTAEQMLQFRVDALAEAEELCRSLATTDCIDSNITRHECADAIQKLKNGY